MKSKLRYLLGRCVTIWGSIFALLLWFIIACTGCEYVPVAYLIKFLADNHPDCFSGLGYGILVCFVWGSIICSVIYKYIICSPQNKGSDQKEEEKQGQSEEEKEAMIRNAINAANAATKENDGLDPLYHTLGFIFNSVVINIVYVVMLGIALLISLIGYLSLNVAGGVFVKITAMVIGLGLAGIISSALFPG